ncbi:archease [Halopiger aswanensis]|uniref:SHS2 domain-containing protein n=1 Tax=Halopiger aswanensis TaxID=148449 RepID=A0A3R7HI99_9EURY|nr:archease [Halopiger aswanensis]RKD94938.1 SHS2 domain-containing protein [Halopiger aswanensis]
MGYELRDHTADVAVAATGDSLEGVFASVADGLAAASCDEIPAADADESGDRFSVTVAAESREALLFDYLDEVIYLRDVRAELPVDHCVEAIREPGEAADDDGNGDEPDDNRWSLEATARGVPLAEIDAREVKAVTYSEMELERRDDGWEAYVVFDV